MEVSIRLIHASQVRPLGRWHLSWDFKDWETLLLLQGRESLGRGNCMCKVCLGGRKEFSMFEDLRKDPYSWSTEVKGEWGAGDVQEGGREQRAAHAGPLRWR